MLGPEEIMRTLKRRGYKVTPQRVLVARIILENIDRHPSLRDIHLLASKIQPGIGIGTVYNTIKMLEEAGVITTFQLEGKLHVDRPHLHVNILCEDTGEIVDAEGISDIVGSLKDRMDSLGMGVKNIIVMADCRKKKPP